MAKTCATKVLPATSCSTFALRERMRLPSPAARMTAASGRFLRLLPRAFVACCDFFIGTGLFSVIGERMARRVPF